MKRFAVAVIAALLISSQPAGAAPKTIAAIEITKVSDIAEHEGVTISGQGITIFSNVEKKVLLSSLDFTGTEKWKLVIEGSADQIAMAATSDREGNTWLAGLTSAVEAVESQSATSTPVNVDGVVVDLHHLGDALGVDREVGGLGHGAFQREHGIVGGEGRTIVKLDAGAQRHAQLRGRYLGPARGQQRLGA